MRCCGNDYFTDPECFDIIHADPLVVECCECGKVIRMDCQGIKCRDCPMECEEVEE